MSLGYPSLRPKVDGTHSITQKEGSFGVPDVMTYGFQNQKEQIAPTHTLEFSERHWDENQDRMDFAMLRNMQGIAAPLKLNMERQTAAKMQRLPCLRSSNLMMDSLTGKLDTIDFDDCFNPIDCPAEVMGQPHAIMEKRLNLL